ncbi:hypothetical protein QE152_g24444 [Popillia japonica]|uniref:Uncharacterized protein n=1 Tax=Popillia japonica TaxID=7064 RepID=A0AAW1KES1_POPJA
MSVKSVAYVGNVAEFENSSSKPEENIVDISTLEIKAPDGTFPENDLVTVARPQCLPGYRRDRNGVCRRVA